MTSLRILLSLAVITLWSVPSAAQWLVELDLDGTVGNGPDTVDVVVGELIEGDVWFYGTASIFAFGFRLCRPDGGLEFVGLEYHVPEVWTIGPVIWDPGCDQVESVDFTFSEPIALPAMLATLLYRAAIDQTIAHVSLQNGGYFDTAFGSGYVDNIGDTLATVRIGATSTESSSWGAVKGMFR